MPDLPEHEERRIRDYVDSQSRDDPATLVQKVGTRRILGRVYELYDVHCERSRWWVISDPTNLYLQDDFPEVEQAFIFHLGLGLYMAQRSRMELDEDDEDRISGAWRRYQQAVDAMDTASEAEDFQAIGIRCRDALLAFVHDYADAEWVGEVDSPPQRSNFKAWGNIFAERLARDYLRAYAKALVDKTWDLAVWLQHYRDATPWDAEVVIDATADLLGLFGVLMRRLESGPSERCPTCGSYALDEDTEVVEEPEPGGFLTSTVCRACEWRSDRAFTSWETHFEGADIEGYLSRPSTGVSDRLHRHKPSVDDPTGAE